jgi:hypothetical protein
MTGLKCDKTQKKYKFVLYNLLNKMLVNKKASRSIAIVKALLIILRKNYAKLTNIAFLALYFISLLF